MNTRTKIGIASAVLLIALASIRMGLFSRGPTDQEAIKAALDDATQAAKEGRAGPVLDFISTQLEYNGVAEINRSQIAKVVKESHPEVTIEKPDAAVSGDSATIVTPVHVKGQILGGSPIEQDFKNVTLIFRREDTLRWLIFPGKTWRLSKVSAPDAPNVGDGGQ